MASENLEAAAYCLRMELADLGDFLDGGERSSFPVTSRQMTIDSELLRAQSVIVQARVDEDPFEFLVD